MATRRRHLHPAPSPSIDAGPHAHERRVDEGAPEYIGGERASDDDADVAIDDAEESSSIPIVSLVAGDDASGERLDKWLAMHLPDHSRSRLQHWIVDGSVRVDGRAATGVRQAVWPGARIEVAMRSSGDETSFVAEPVAFEIVHEDDALIVIDKRAGLVVHPGNGHRSGTLQNGLLHHAPSLAAVPRAGIVHRLDKETSGLMVVAKTLEAQTHLVRQLQARSVRRDYAALVRGAPPVAGRIDHPIGRDPRDRIRMTAFMRASATPATAKPAATRFVTWVVNDEPGHGPHALVACSLETGRTHQIRVHMKAIGHPLVGDALYGRREAGLPFGRQALHAWRLGLLHPTTDRAMTWRSPLPADFTSLASTLGIDATATLDAHADRTIT